MVEKSSRWAMTVYEPQFGCLEVMPPLVAEWGWQDETCPTTGKLHKQGYLRTHQQQRFAAMRKAFPGVHLEIARDWNKLLNYCKKTDTAVAGTQVHKTNDIPSLFTYSSELATKLANIQRRQEVVYADVDRLVRMDIENGRQGIEWIASNPQFITTWKKYWKEMILRARYHPLVADRQTDTQNNSPEEYNGTHSQSSSCDNAEAEAEPEGTQGT